MNFEGNVIKGRGEGAKTGFPTANIKVKEASESGIYAGYVNLIEDNSANLKALFYIPEDDRNLIECHILDFEERDLYGCRISVRLIYKIRNTRKFLSLKEANLQIKDDEQKAREWFKSNPPV